MDNHVECYLKGEELQEMSKNNEIHKPNEMTSIEMLRVNIFTCDDDMMEFYTGFPNTLFYSILQCISNYIVFHVRDIWAFYVFI